MKLVRPNGSAIFDSRVLLFVFGTGILVILVVFVIVIINMNRKTSNIFLTKQEALHYLRADADGFYKTLKPADLAVRNTGTVDEYVRGMDKCVDDFTPGEMKTLTRAIENSNRYLQKMNSPWFNGTKCAGIPWKLACVVGEAYEAGLPHTRDDIVFFPRRNLAQPERRFTQTLIHERIHVYQKMYRDDAEKYISQNGYTHHEPARSNQTRANPDIDGWTYVDRSGTVMAANYTENAKSLRDVILPKNGYEYEHPLEKMAIDIADGYIHN